MSDFFAHTADDRSWEPLAVHLCAVAELAGRFGAAFDSQEWATLAGRWHDLGKYSLDFQKYLRANAGDDAHADELAGRVDHSTAGAQWAKQQHTGLGMILSHIIASHHSGLLDYSAQIGTASLEQRLSKTIPTWREVVPADVLTLPLPATPNLGKPESHQYAAFRVAFWIRMLFSTLVDADFLATEAFMNPEQAAMRPGQAPTVADLKTTLDGFLEDLMGKTVDTEVNQQRARVLDACRVRAQEAPGFFELCVPTGGGKTYSSLAFALKHAVTHGLRRVIVAVPFTSIIEQNAEAYRKAFGTLGREVVLEHHSNLDPDQETDVNRLQAENWDSPLVVTTNVQLFESLFACRTSRCRKLHNLARSVLVLDEVQTLPVDLLKPTLWTLRELVELYGCSVVLCSATQPALAKRDNFEIGLSGIRPIIEEPAALYAAMRRTRVKVEDCLQDEELVPRLLGHEQVLCVVNTRAHAARLRGLLGDQTGHFHLSTRMCAAHRLETLETIRTRLKAGQPCRVVSTQLVEAGVDLDFPAVYRARCGLDSLAQAAGRCNREGLRESGEVTFFSAAELPPVGFLRQTAQTAEELLAQHPDPLAPEAIEAYFRLHYWLRSERWDHRKVLDAVGSNPSTMRFQFREMASLYRFIPDEGDDLLVPWKDEGQSLRHALQRPYPPGRDVWRRLQRFCVHVRAHELNKLKEAGAVECLCQRWVLSDPNRYDPHLGLVFDRNLKAEDLVV
jgi:CRISPR-associated endonuclease/helicase Cas3